MASHDKVAVITGGGTGIGKACALAFVKDGYRVAISGRRAEPLGPLRVAGASKVFEIRGVSGEQHGHVR